MSYLSHSIKKYQEVKIFDMFSTFLEVEIEHQDEDRW